MARGQFQVDCVILTRNVNAKTQGRLLSDSTTSSALGKSRPAQGHLEPWNLVQEAPAGQGVNSLLLGLGVEVRAGMKRFLWGLGETREVLEHFTSQGSYCSLSAEPPPCTRKHFNSHWELSPFPMPGGAHRQTPITTPCLGRALMQRRPRAGLQMRGWAKALRDSISLPGTYHSEWG